MASLPLAPAADRREAILAGLVLVAAAVSAGLLWALLDGTAMLALLLAAGLTALAGGGIFAALRARPAARAEPPADTTLLAAVIEDARDAMALTTREGHLVAVNAAYRALTPDLPPPDRLPLGADGAAAIGEAARVAWRDGVAEARGLIWQDVAHDLTVRRAGYAEDHLIWRLRRSRPRTTVEFARALIEGMGGAQLGAAGVMAALVDHDGRMIAGNGAFAARALGHSEAVLRDRHFVDLLQAADDGAIRIARDMDDADTLRVITVPLEGGVEEGPSLFLLLDHGEAGSAARGTATVHLHGLLAMLPLGLALTERDGRFLFMNEAFGRAAGVEPGDPVLYPSDLVVDEDKATVSDAVHRFAAGRALPGDLSIRLKHRPEEPVALTIAGAKGLGDAAVLLSLKDNSEESKLKRQVAQATKMQAVGQLAGGVAHDFNNILTAIIGHCDLMAMRHTPGDSDYDDIQQIRNNSNRAAGLTRQLLAFSRQQTLRPQILQLPDVIAETSNLLKRLLGETVRLQVKHGRNLGAVRADPGQLEQVIMNLAVNARDAMPEGGTLTIQTYPVSAADVRRMASEIMPVGDYTAMKATDTGHGIPDEIIGKIFEPFFTTKEVGKGTGLGLSTVYGIVKQTDGFIFADSPPEGGTSFTIYLPVHKAAPKPQGPVRVEPAGEIWGSGTILLVEDEAMVRAVAERALQRQGYTILTATNGEEALELMEARAEAGETIDLLISDVVMPTMDGPTMVRHARERFPVLPILFMSGYAEEQLRKSIDLDRIAFLPKPFSVQQLATAARDALVKG